MGSSLDHPWPAGSWVRLKDGVLGPDCRTGIIKAHYSGQGYAVRHDHQSEDRWLNWTYGDFKLEAVR